MAPRGGVIGDKKGNLFGTTSDGGQNQHGTVFKINAKGKESILYSFTGAADGGLPLAGLIKDKQGNLYGTTYQGGNQSVDCTYGYCGVAFKLTKRGVFTVLHAFGFYDGANPVGALVMDHHGNLWGTTETGGDGGVDGYYGGTVFEITTSGVYRVVFSFNNPEFGQYPDTTLIEDVNGDFYGTTARGGAYNDGVAFRMSPSGKEKIFTSFDGQAVGGSPWGGLALGSDGSLYGMTSGGGNPNCGCGTVYKLKK